jgi:hypothetical protein
MARQPLNTRLPNTEITLGPRTLAERPRAAALIAECIATWSEVELQTGRLVGEMLGVPFEPVTAFYLSLANQRDKRRTLDPIAKYVFTNPDYHSLYDAIMRARSSSENERIKFAHSLFGIASDDLLGIIMIDSVDRIRHMFEIEAMGRQQTKGEDYGFIILLTKEVLEKHMEIRDYIYHYTITDIESILGDMQSLHTIILQFMMFSIALRQGQDSVVQQLYRKLSETPLVRRFLSQI